jgi:hypothetical protein
MHPLLLQSEPVVLHSIDLVGIGLKSSRATRCAAVQPDASRYHTKDDARKKGPTADPNNAQSYTRAPEPRNCADLSQNEYGYLACVTDAAGLRISLLRFDDTSLYRGWLYQRSRSLCISFSASTFR